MQTLRPMIGFLILGIALSPEAAATAEDEKEADQTVAAAREDKPVPGPPVSVKVEGALPYVPTSNTIATRLPLSLRLTPANVGTVTEPLLREQHALVLGDALKNVSGVNVQTFSDVVDFFVIRGFDSLSSGLVLTDGAPEPEVTFYQMYNIDRVEVLKGPSGFLYGSNPLAGAVNIVRRQPVPGRFGQAGVAAGSFGTYEGSLDYNLATSDGDLAFRINSGWRQSESYRDEKENRSLGVNPALTWRIGPNSSLNVNLERVDSDYEPDSGLPIFNGRIADVPRERSYQSPFDDSEQQLSRIQIDFETKLSNRWTLRNKTYSRDLEWVSNGTLFNGVFPDPNNSFRPGVSRTLVLLDDNQRFVGNQLEAVLTGQTGTVQHKLLAGVEVARYGDDFTLDIAALPSIDLEDPDETAGTPLFFIPGQSSEGDSRSFVVAPYAIDHIRFSDRFHALAGVRLDTIDYEDRISHSGRQDSTHDSEVSPMAGLVYSPSSRLSLYANAGASFSPPSARIVQEDREPEESVQYEVGTKMDALPGKIQLTVAAYHMERENMAIPDDNGFTQQVGDQRARGVELEVMAEPMRNLRAFLTYAFNHAELTRFTERVVVGFDPNTGPVFGTVDRSGNDPAFAPEHILNLWVSKQFDNGLGVAGGPRYVSDQFIAEDNEFAIDDYVVVDGSVFYRRGDWEMRLNLKNLTSRDYETRGFGSSSVIPAPPFAAYGGVQYRF